MKKRYDMKPGVVLPDTQQMQKALGICQEIYNKYKYVFVVTCGSESWKLVGGKQKRVLHSTVRSFHYFNFAFDCRIKNIRSKIILGKIVKEIKSRLKVLSDNYTVLCESNHIHIHWNGV